MARTAPRRAGVSAFGVGGTNAHVVVEQPPVDSTARRARRPRPPHLVVLSAADGAALDRAATRLAAHLRTHDVLPQDVVRTLATGRAHTGRATRRHRNRHRRTRRAAGVPWHHCAGRVPGDGPAPLVFAFPGQGAQYPGMARPLAAVLPGFSAALATAARRVRPHHRSNWSAARCSTRVSRRRPGRDRPGPARPVRRRVRRRDGAARARPHPAAVTGHSLGEITAACVAGALDLADAARLVTVRGAAMQQCPPGAMLALTCGEQGPLTWYAHPAWRWRLAAVNSPDHTVVAGPPDVVDGFEAWLSGRAFARRLRSRRAFHTALVDAAVRHCAEALAGMRLGPPTHAVGQPQRRTVLPGAPVGATLFTAQARHTVLVRAITAAAGRLGSPMRSWSRSGQATHCPLWRRAAASPPCRCAAGRPGADDEAVPDRPGTTVDRRSAGGRSTRRAPPGAASTFPATPSTGHATWPPRPDRHPPGTTRRLSSRARHRPGAGCDRFATGRDGGIGATPGADRPAGAFSRTCRRCSADCGAICSVGTSCPMTPTSSRWAATR